MKAGDLKISVVIPVHNHGRYLGEAIQSILAQTRPAAEIIVIDNCSTDDTADVAKSFLPRIRYLYEERKGLGEARNRGVEAAKGDFIAYLDADDIWFPEKLAVQVEAFAIRPGIDLVGAFVETFYSPELDPEMRKRIRCPPGPLPGLAASALMAKRDVYDRVGLYETHWHVGSDLNWLTRACDAGLETFIVPQVLIRRRLHSQNSGWREREYARERVLILKQAIDRRGAVDATAKSEGGGKMNRGEER